MRLAKGGIKILHITLFIIFGVMPFSNFCIANQCANIRKCILTILGQIFMKRRYRCR